MAVKWRRNMSPKWKRGQLPKSCQSVVDYLNEQGIEITADALMNQDPLKRKNAFTAFNVVLQEFGEETMAKYKQITDVKQQREWLAIFLIEAEDGISNMVTEVKKGKREQGSQEDHLAH